MIRETTRTAMSLLAFLKDVYVPAHLGIADSTVHQFTVSIRVLERWIGRTVQVEELSDDLVRRFLSAYHRKVEPATVNAKRRHLLALWRFAHEEGWVDSPPGNIRRAPETIHSPEAWTVGEVSRILDAAGQERGKILDIPASKWWLSLILAIYDTGERIGAVMQVEPRDVSLALGLVYFRPEIRKQRKGRWCKLSGQTLEAVRAIYNEDNSYLWPCPWTDEWLRLKFHRICRRAGVDVGRGRGGVFHKLRRTSGTLVEAAGGDGAKHLGDVRKVFEDHYLDPRLGQFSQVDLLPRPHLPPSSGGERQGRLF